MSLLYREAISETCFTLSSNTVFNLLLYFSCVLVWDTRPPKGPQQPTTKKESEGPKNPMGVPDTFKHLDLSWKPMLKVNISYKTKIMGLSMIKTFIVISFGKLIQVHCDIIHNKS